MEYIIFWNSQGTEHYEFHYARVTSIGEAERRLEEIAALNGLANKASDIVCYELGNKVAFTTTTSVTLIS